MKNVIWTRPDGTVAVTSIFDDTVDSAEYANALQSRGDVPPDWVAEAFDTESFPSWPRQEDWRVVGGALVVSLPSAKASTKGRLTAQRDPLLRDLYLQIQIAGETGGDTSSMLARKAELLALPGRVDACTSLDELATLTVD